MKKKIRSLTDPWESSWDQPDQPRWMRGMRGVPEDEIMNLYNDYQFIQNDDCRAVWNPKEPNKTRYTLSRICRPGTLTATIYNEDMAVQTLVAKNDGTIELNVINPKATVMVTGGMVNSVLGEVSLVWNGVPDKMDRLVASYEYCLEDNKLWSGKR